MSFSVIILAAGQGKRMKSKRPKVLHTLGGKPLLTHLLEKVQSFDPFSLSVVVGHEADAVQTLHQRFSGVRWVLQAEQRGTGHAVLQALSGLPAHNHPVLILVGDAPLVRLETLNHLLAASSKASLVLLTTRLDEPAGMGRILRDTDENVVGIVEEKDATPQQKNIKEINAGIYMVERDLLAEFLPTMTAQNQQQEYYLTDIVQFAVNKLCTIHAISVKDAWEVMGVNTCSQLANLERQWQYTQAQVLLANGVTLLDPYRLDIRGEVQIEPDVTIDINVVLEGRVTIQEGAYIGPNAVIKNSNIGAYARIEANSVIEGAQVASYCSVGPFARLRPGTVLGEAAKIGNFVEIKNAQIGASSKASHLSYIGDAFIGEDVNIGAGTITCNYDGANKHQTIIDDRVFIGSGTQLVAPLKIHQGATIAAGTTVLEDVAAETLILNPKSQKSIQGWQRPEKNQKPGADKIREV